MSGVKLLGQVEQPPPGVRLLGVVKQREQPNGWAGYAEAPWYEKVGMNTVAGMGEAFGDAMGMVNRPLDAGDGRSLTEADKFHADVAAMEENAPQGWLARNYRGAVRSMAPMAVIRKAGLPGIIAYNAANRYSQGIGEARQAGLAPGQQLAHAAGVGVIEGGVTALFQRFMPGLESTIAKGLVPKQGLKAALTQAAKSTLQEYPEEVVIAAADRAVSRLSGVDQSKLTWGQVAQEFLVDLPTQTAMMGGAANAPNVAVAAAMEPQHQREADDFIPDPDPVVLRRMLDERRGQGTADTLEALAGIEAPSRKNFEEAGIKVEGHFKSAAGRRKFARKLNETLQQERMSASAPLDPDPTAVDDARQLPDLPEGNIEHQLGKVVRNRASLSLEEAQSWIDRIEAALQNEGDVRRQNAFASAKAALQERLAQQPATQPPVETPPVEQALPRVHTEPQPVSPPVVIDEQGMRQEVPVAPVVEQPPTPVAEEPPPVTFEPEQPPVSVPPPAVTQAPPASVLESLRQDPALAQRLSQSAGVKEGVTVGQHTEAVLGNYRQNADFDAIGATGQKYGIADLPRLIEHAVALHDIGKPDAIAAGDKGRQHEFTLPILERTLAAQGFAPKEIAVAKALVGNDAIGELLQGKIAPAQAVRQLSVQARMAGMELPDFLGLQTLLYKSDAGSYPSLRDSLFAKKGHKLYVAKERFGILEEMVYGEVRETPWLGGSAGTGREEPRGGAGYRGASGFVHGTATKFDKPDASKDTGRNRVGPGLYLVSTEDQDVARHYSKRAFNRVLALFDGKTKAIIKAADAKQLLHYVSLAQQRSASFADSNPKEAARWQTAAELLQGIHDGVIGQHTLAIDYAPQKVLDLGSDDARGRMLSLDERRAIVGGFTDTQEAIKAIGNLERGFEVYDALRAKFGAKAVNDAIRAAGYDTIHFVHKSGGYNRPYSVFTALSHDAAAVAPALPAPKKKKGWNDLKKKPEVAEAPPEVAETTQASEPVDAKPPTVIEYAGESYGDRKTGAILHPSAKDPGKWQVTRFDSDGFSGDTQYATREEAERDVKRDGYKKGKKQLESLSQTERFAKGNERTQLVRMINEGADHKTIMDAYASGGLEAARAAVPEATRIQNEQREQWRRQASEQPVNPGSIRVEPQAPAEAAAGPAAQIVSKRGQRAIPGLEEEAARMEAVEAENARWNTYGEEMVARGIGVTEEAAKAFLANFTAKVRKSLTDDPEADSITIADALLEDMAFSKSGAYRTDQSRRDTAAEILEPAVTELVGEIAATLDTAAGWKVGQSVETRYPKMFGKITGFEADDGVVVARVKPDDGTDGTTVELGDLSEYEPEAEAEKSPQGLDSAREDYKNEVAKIDAEFAELEKRLSREKGQLQRSAKKDRHKRIEEIEKQWREAKEVASQRRVKAGEALQTIHKDSPEAKEAAAKAKAAKDDDAKLKAQSAAQADEVDWQRIVSAGGYAKTKADTEAEIRDLTGRLARTKDANKWKLESTLKNRTTQLERIEALNARFGTAATAPPEPVAEVEKPTVKPLPQQNPWVNSNVEDEQKWYGKRVRVTSEYDQEPYEGIVQRVLNRGAVVEVMPDGIGSTFRVKNERVTLLGESPRAIPSQPSGPVEPLGDAPKVSFGDQGDDAKVQEELAEQYRKRYTTLAEQASDVRKQIRGLRSNAYKKRNQLSSDANSLESRAREEEKQYRRAQDNVILGKLAAISANPPTPEHGWAAYGRSHELKAQQYFDHAHPLYDRKEGQKSQDISDEATLKLVPSAEAAIRAKGLSDKQDVERAAHTAVQQFMREPWSYKSIADATDYGMDAVRRERLATPAMGRLDEALKEVGQTWRNKDYAPYGHLDAKQVEGFYQRAQEAAKDDSDWREKLAAVFAEVESANDAAKATAAQKQAEENERNRVEAEKLAVEKAQADRERAKGIAKETLYWKSVSSRAKAVRGKQETITLKKGDSEGDVKAEVLDDVWAITTTPKTPTEPASYSLMHVPTGLSLTSASTPKKIKELWVHGQDAGLDWASLKTVEDVKAAKPHPDSVRRSWDSEQLRELQPEVSARILDTVQSADVPFQADLVLSAAELGLGSNQEAKVLERRSFSGSGGGGEPSILKSIADATAEFRYNPVFTVDSKKNLVFRDGFKYTLKPEIFNLAPGELTVGQTVGINLADFSIPYATEQEVVAEMLSNQGFSNVAKPKSGTVVTASWKGRKVTVGQRGKEDWGASDGSDASKRANSAIERIRWTQPGQADDGPSKGKVGPPLGAATSTMKSWEPSPQPTGKSSWQEDQEEAATPAPKKGRKKAGKADVQALSSLPTVPVSLGKKSEAPIAAQDVIKTISQSFGVPIRSGRMGMPKRVAGIYKQRPEVIRTRGKFNADLAVVSHELGHHIDKQTGILNTLPTSIEDALAALDYEPEKARTFEGFAEYIRMRLTGEPTPAALDSWFDTWQAQNKPFAAKFSKATDLITRWREQGAEARAESQRKPMGWQAKVLDQPWGETLAEKGQALKRRIHYEFVDRFERVKAYDKLVREKGWQAGVDAMAGDLIAAFNMSTSAHVERALLDGVHTVSSDHRVLGKGLGEFHDLITPAEYTDWANYHTARHVLDVAEKTPGYNPGMSAEDAQYIVDQAEGEQLERFEKASQLLTDLNNARLEMLVDAGVLSPDDAKRMLDKWGQTYTSLRRVKDTGVARRIMSSLLRVPNPVKGRSKEGSGRPIMDPVEATILNLMDAYDAALKQQVLLKLVQQGVPEFGGVEGMGEWIEKVDPNRKATTGQLNEILDSLVEAGFDPDLIREVKVVSMARRGEMPDPKDLDWIAGRLGIDQANTDNILRDIVAAGDENGVPDAETAIALWRPDFSIKPDEKIFRLVIKGKPHLFELSPDLHDALQGMTPMQFGMMLRPLVAMTRLTKLGATGISTTFSAGNVMRDYPTFQAQTKHTKGLDAVLMPAVAAGWNAKSFAGKGGNEVVKLYEEFGGKIATRLGGDYSSIKNVRADVTGHSVGAMEFTSRGVDRLRDFIGLFEAGPRIAEFYGYLKEQGYDLKDGKVVDKDGNPARPPRGVLIGATLAARSVTTDFTRAGRSARALDAFIPFFNAAIQSNLKSGTTVGEIAMGKKNWKQRAIALSLMSTASLMYALLRADDDDYKEQPEWLKRRYWTFGVNGQTYARIPKPHDWGLMANLIEASVAQMKGSERAELKDAVLTDLQYRNPASLPPIVEAGMGWMNYSTFRGGPIESRSMQNVDPSVRANPNTSPAARFIGQFTGAANLSPVKVDHILNETSGGLWGKTIGAGSLPDAASKWSGMSAFTVSRDYSETVEDFYDELGRTKLAAETAKFQGKPDAKLSDEANRMEAYAELMTAIRAPVKDEKDREARFEHEQYAIGLARAVLGKDELDAYPNPLVRDDLPDAVQSIVNAHLGAKLKTATEPVYEKQPKQEQAEFEATKAERDATVSRALSLLKDAALTPERRVALLNAGMKKSGMKLDSDAARGRRKRLNERLANP